MSHDAAVTSVGQGAGSISSVEIYRDEAALILKRIAMTVILAIVIAFLLSNKASVLQVIDHPISSVKVSGDLTFLKQETVEHSLSALMGSGFLMADLDEIKKTVELLPWVHQATVSRIWPGEIRLLLSEQVAVGYWNDTSFINADGDVFTPEKIGSDVVDGLIGLPLLVGANEYGREKRLRMLNTLSYIQNGLQQYGLGLTQLELEPRNVWDLKLSNGIGIAIGELDMVSASGLQTLETKIERIGTVFSARAGIEINNIERIDARYPNGVAIKWKALTNK
jgi:cell division protein FtsQ